MTRDYSFSFTLERLASHKAKNSSESEQESYKGLQPEEPPYLSIKKDAYLRGKCFKDTWRKGLQLLLLAMQPFLNVLIQTKFKVLKTE